MPYQTYIARQGTQVLKNLTTEQKELLKVQMGARLLDGGIVQDKALYQKFLKSLGGSSV